MGQLEDPPGLVLPFVGEAGNTGVLLLALASHRATDT